MALVCFRLRKFSIKEEMLIKTVEWSFSIYDKDIYSLGDLLYRSYCISHKAYNSVCHRTKIRKVITPSYMQRVFSIKQI